MLIANPFVALLSLLPIHAEPMMVDGEAKALVLFENGAAAMVSPDGAFSMIEPERPPVLTATWKDDAGVEHGVSTDCAGLTLARCIRQHQQTVAALRVAFPPRKPKDEEKDGGR